MWFHLMLVFTFLQFRLLLKRVKFLVVCFESLIDLSFLVSFFLVLKRMGLHCARIVMHHYILEALSHI